MNHPKLNISQAWDAATALRLANDKRESTKVGRPASVENPLKTLRGRCEGTPRLGEKDKSRRPRSAHGGDIFDPETGQVIQLRVVEAVVEKLGRLRGHGEIIEKYMPETGIWSAVSDNEIGQVVIGLLRNKVTSHIVQSVVRLMHVHLHRDADDCKTDFEKLNLGNGVLCTETLKLLDFSHKYNHRNKLPFSYAPNAKAPTWEAMLKSTFRDSPDQVRLLQNIFGYCLISKNLYQHFFLFLGRGANGKSVVLNTLGAMLGRNNVCSLPLDNLGHNFMLAGLFNMLANIVTEVDTSRAMRSSMLKALVGDDFITADRKHKTPIMFRPTAKHIFAVNEMPRFSDASHGLSRRAVIVQFSRTFSPKEQDPLLSEKLEQELSGIFNWAIGGLRDLRSEGHLYIPESSHRIQQQFLEAQNPVMLFVKEECRLDSGRIRRKDLFRSYKIWVDEAGVSKYRMSRQRLYDQLRADYPDITTKRTGGEDYFVGISVSTRMERMLASIDVKLEGEKGKENS